MAHGLNQDSLLRYSRQLAIVGLDGQAQLQTAKVLCVGAGGLGCPVLQYLAAAGVGTLMIADPDVVELSNLQRQVLFSEDMVGQNKAEAAVRRLQASNSNLHFTSIAHRIDESWLKTMPSVDVVVDATDNFVTRYALNHACRQRAIPLVSASVLQTQAQLSVFNYQSGPCYQCLYPCPPPLDTVPSCATAGVMGVTPGVIGVLQANEVIKILLGSPDVLSGQLLTMNLQTLAVELCEINRQSTCHRNGCSKTEVQFESTQSDQIPEVDCDTVLQWQHEGRELHWLDVREDYERAITAIPSQHLPLSVLRLDPSVISDQGQWVVICKSGGRSRQAVKQLLATGMTHVYSLKGGLMAWLDATNSTLMRY